MLQAQATYTYEAMTQRPGKYYQKSRYLPYFFANWQEVQSTSDDGLVVDFDLNSAYKRDCTELRNRTSVRLVINDYGFVYEA